MNIKQNITSSRIILKSYVNKYAFVGLGIAICSILIASLFVSFQITGSINIDGFVKAQLTNPAIWILDLTPFIFAYWGQSFCYGLVDKAESILTDKTNEFLHKSGALEAKLKYENLHDNLTHLPNNRLFSEQVAQSIQQIGKLNELAVIILKINDFKSLSSKFGNFNVNSVIIQFTKKLKALLVDHYMLQATMGINLLARIESDEFALLLPRLTKKLNLNELLSSIINSTTVNLMVDGIHVNITTTAGVAVYPVHGDTDFSLISHARIALYHAKMEGKPYIMYNSNMEDNFTTNRIAIDELKRAIENNELEIYYQPTVELATGKIIGAEALVRFEHEQSGLISAEKFIPLIEGSNLIHQLTSFLLKRVIKQLALWHQEGHLIYVSVNLSAQDAIDKELPAFIEKLLHKNKIEPGYLKLEFTEQACLSDQAKSIEVLNKLSDLGVKISIDDFCSGYTSFIYLTNFPIDEIKIEKNLILDSAKDKKKAKIVEAIIKLAQILELDVSAYGVADQNIMELLMRFGCLYGQGFYFSRAVSLKEFNTLLNKKFLLLTKQG